MYFITDDCDYDDGTRYKTLEGARFARKYLLAKIGEHMGDHTHVAEVETGRIIPEPGAWVVVTEDGEGMTFSKDDDTPFDLYHYGDVEHQPVWVPNYEWV